MLYLVNDIKEMVCWNLYFKCEDLIVIVLLIYYDMKIGDKGMGNLVLII